MAEASRDQNFITTLLGVSNVDGKTPVRVYADPVTHRLLVDNGGGGGGGTVTSFSFTDANGIAGVVTNPTTTPNLTLSLGDITPTSVVASGTLRSNTSLILEETGAGTDTITVQAPSSIAASYTLTLPTTDGNNGEFLQTDGNGVLTWAAGAAGANTSLSNLSSVAINTTLLPGSNDGAALGSGTLSFSDLFLASGALINFANGNSVITHSSAILTVSTGDLRVTTAGTNAASVVTVGGTQTLTNKQLTAATVNTSFTPTSNDGSALGSGTLSFADLFLASGGVINFNNGDVTITHSSNTLTFNGATSGYIFNDPVTIDGNVTLDPSGGGGAGTNRTIDWGANYGNPALWLYNNGAGSRYGWGLQAGEMQFFIITSNHYSWNGGGDLNPSGTNEVMRLDPTTTTLTINTLVPYNNDAGALGNATTSYSDLFLASGALINFANGNWTATHTSGILTVGTSMDIRMTTAGTNSASVATVGGTQTLTSKRVTPRVNTTTSSATPTINTDTTDAFSITALATNITSMTTNLSGTPTNFQKLIIRIKDNGTARSIAWGASFAAMGVVLPTTTVISKTLTVGFLWDSVASVWGCVASAQEA